ncbi:predicted protein [Histoplasma mississippiense (nom. inval.)]|uniref:predicted protein n=1 Tax=Ajellomyces capsulatus (strain NAm1 / WU24) TaxID=2059318 RepID=UPI000157D02F|nr:predicted protein [Histoplasma mississippiense (nom. inval.)]EDN04236.1 predicted protein [Histoplasma mississippiense (nom. inval.)]
MNPSTRWTSNRLDEEVEHAGPKPSCDVKPVGRQTRWTPTRWDVETRPRSALTHGPELVGMNPSTRWTSNPLDEEVEHAGPNPVGRQTRPRSALTRWDVESVR